MLIDDDLNVKSVLPLPIKGGKCKVSAVRYFMTAIRGLVCLRSIGFPRFR